MKTIQIEDISFLVRKSARIKSIKISINHQGNAVLSVPWYCPVRAAALFAHKNIDWVRRHMERHQSPQTFQNGQTILISGQSVQIMHQTKRTPTHINNGILYVGGDSTFLHRRICDFAKKELAHHITILVDQMTNEMNTPYQKITLRNTSSRWGSCSTQKNLSFCWKLAFAPDFIIHYLVAHEVAHLTHMNHSRHFWRTVDTLTPHRITAEKWLKDHGTELQAIV